jgi:hypothetical protein
MVHFDNLIVFFYMVTDEPSDVSLTLHMYKKPQSYKLLGSIFRRASLRVENIDCTNFIY